MTRFLSESMQATEPSFRLGLRHLEKANGHPNTDIRFTAEVMQATQQKLRELGLDPYDTTAQELYAALQSRIKTDDERLTRSLRMRAASFISAEADRNDGLLHALREVARETSCFALKNSVLKALLKKQAPKKALKQLGYRSLDSMLKHESCVQILAAAWLLEPAAWRQKFTDQYKRLQPSDFETRQMAIEQPRADRWQALAERALREKRHNVFGFSELGTLVILPLPDHAPSGSLTAALSLSLHQLNEIQAGSTYLKLCQVRPDFGTMVQTVAAGEPMLSAHQLDQAVPWHIIQRFYARMQHLFGTQLFEPHVDTRDMVWHDVEAIMTKLEPSFHVWQSSSYLGMLHRGEIVSMNLVDAALNYCNQLPFEQRMHQQFRSSMWHELLVRYLQPHTVEQTVLAQLQPTLAAETVMA